MTSGANLSVVEIHPLSESRLTDFMAFFEGEAFSDNAHWSSCYCQCFYEDHAKVRWAGRSGAENRARAVERVCSREMQGLLAYRQGEVVGWCNAAPRALLHSLDAEPIDKPERVGTILCFLVAPNSRGRGIATALLKAACASLKAQGLAIVEANPRPQAKQDAENHFGPLGMYLAAGFEVRRTDPDGSVWVEQQL
ncbi:MAG: GNAT family N-acetyltransferase [Caldimonas sp.]